MIVPVVASDGWAIGSAPAAPAGTAALELDGLVATVDPARLGRPYSDVFDPLLARHTVRVLYGDLAADWPRGLDGFVEVVDSEEGDSVARVGLLLWLKRYQPIPLDPALLSAELAVSWARLRGIHTDDDSELIAIAADLVSASRELRASAEMPMRGRLLRLVEEAFSFLPVPGLVPELLREIHHERELLQLLREWSLDVVPSADQSWFDILGVPSAAHLGEGERRYSLDWERVPADLLPAPESSVRANLTDGRLAVEVSGAPRWTRHPAFPRQLHQPEEVWATVRAQGWPIPLARIRLEYDRAGRVWRSETQLDEDALWVIDRRAWSVDVHGQGITWEPGDPIAAEATRWAARGVVGARIGRATGSGRQLTEARRAWRRSMQLWLEAGDEAKAEECDRLGDEDAEVQELSVAELWLIESGGR